MVMPYRRKIGLCFAVHQKQSEPHRDNKHGDYTQEYGSTHPFPFTMRSVEYRNSAFPVLTTGDSGLMVFISRTG